MARCFLSQNDSFYLESLPIPNFPSPSHHSLYYTDRNGLDEAPNHFQEPKINIYQGFLGRGVLKMIGAGIRPTSFQTEQNITRGLMHFWSRSYNSNLDKKCIYGATLDNEQFQTLEISTLDNEQFQTRSWTEVGSPYYRVLSWNHALFR